MVISYGCYVNVSHAWPSHTCRFYLAPLPLCMSHDHQPSCHRPSICSLMTDQSCITASFFVPLLSICRSKVDRQVHVCDSFLQLHAHAGPVSCVCMCVCVCVCVCVCICMYMCVYVCVCICMYMCVCVYLHVHVGVCVCICMYMCVCVFVYLHVCTCVCVYLHVHVCVCVCVCVYLRAWCMFVFAFGCGACAFPSSRSIIKKLNTRHNKHTHLRPNAEYVYGCSSFLYTLAKILAELDRYEYRT